MPVILKKKSDHPDISLKLVGIGGSHLEDGSLLQAAASYVSLGFKVIPDKPQSKEPAVTGWTSLNLTADQLKGHFPTGANISIRLGADSSHLCCIDIDDPLGLKLTERLPKTEMVHGRASMPRSHHFYRISAGDLQSHQYKATSGSVLVEVLYDKRKVVVPPSIHPSGEPVQSYVKGAPALLTASEVTSAVSQFAAAMLLAKAWPAKGSRNDAALALAGMLLNAGWSEADAKGFITDVAKAAGDEEFQTRGDCVKGTAQKLKDCQPVTGKTRLSELIGEANAKQLRQWLKIEGSDITTNGVTSQSYIEELNQRHAVVPVGGAMAIMTETKQPDIDNPQLMRTVMNLGSESDLRLRYKNRKDWEIDPATGKAKRRSIADIWLEHPDRRQFEGIEFLPGVGTPGYYNLFHGWPIPPVEGDCELFIRHIREVICRGNTLIINYVLDWMAHAVQKPTESPEVAIVLQGKQGVGKGVFANEYGALFGEHYLTVYRSDQVAGRFNGHLKGIVVLHLNEATWGGRKEAANVLKGLITDPTTPIEHKGKDIFPVRNYRRIIVSSNDAWPVSVEPDDRRFLVLDVSDAHKEDHEYFAKILDLMATGGRNALMYLLLQRDLSGFNVRKMPPTSFAFDIKLRSTDSVTQWWFQFLQSAEPELWDDLVPKDFLHGDYLECCKKHRIQHPEMLAAFGKTLHVLIPTLESKKITGKSAIKSLISPWKKQERIPHYKLPSLVQCRKYFQEAMKADESIWD